MPANELTALADRVEALEGPDNHIDVLVEVARFTPNSIWTACRANAAGTKIIYTTRTGNEVTCWATDWTLTSEDRIASAVVLRARAGRV